jgi:hypothetical protein
MEPTSRNPTPVPGEMVMIWNAIKFITLSEIIAWIVFVSVTLVLGAFGVGVSQASQAVIAVCWLVLFLAVYQFLHRRRAR